MCCWEWKPRYFCAWCRIPLFWHPKPGELEPCLSSKVTGGRVVKNCVERKVTLVESESIYTGCCVDCARLVGRGEVPAYYKDVKPAKRRANYNSHSNGVKPLEKWIGYDSSTKVVKAPKMYFVRARMGRVTE
ncbi:hypothetical protein VMCG_01251 [Cytospora schulzeri]|uniref:Uncharacterized protein n=1 Tax=Cytospora schulzeri TaxID=448051 RepID=A0A423X6A9_9PEZI|nr:hypothetical protein VMCG_01251 [Valsa malicola]